MDRADEISILFDEFKLAVLSKISSTDVIQQLTETNERLTAELLRANNGSEELHTDTSHNSQSSQAEIDRLSEQRDLAIAKVKEMADKLQECEKKIADLSTNNNSLMVHFKFTNWIQQNQPQLMQQLFTLYNQQPTVA